MSQKSGLADSPFFAAPQPKIETPPLREATPVIPKKIVKKSPNVSVSKKERVHDTTQPSNHDTVVSRHQDTTTAFVNDATIELVRKAVKEFGKEAATHRFTNTEKKELADLIYTYKNQGIRTSENEVTRIAVNFIVEDYKENGENSVLHKILEALNS
jgi:hypothetical protein